MYISPLDILLQSKASTTCKKIAHTICLLTILLVAIIALLYHYSRSRVATNLFTCLPPYSDHQTRIPLFFATTVASTSARVTCTVSDEDNMLIKRYFNDLHILHGNNLRSLVQARRQLDAASAPSPRGQRLDEFTFRSREASGRLPSNTAARQSQNESQARRLQDQLRN